MRVGLVTTFWEHHRCGVAEYARMLLDNMDAPDIEVTRINGPFEFQHLFPRVMAGNYDVIHFNYDCLPPNTPIICRREGIIDVVPIGELGPQMSDSTTCDASVRELEIWDGQDWTRVKSITKRRRRTKDSKHIIRTIETRGGIVETTANHNLMLSNKVKIEAESIKEEHQLLSVTSFPDRENWAVLTKEMAEFLGLIVSEGSINLDSCSMSFCNTDTTLVNRVCELWSRLFLGTFKITYTKLKTPKNPKHDFFKSEEAKKNWKPVGIANLTGRRIKILAIMTWLRDMIYTKSGDKKVPAIVLNSTEELQKAFLSGYYDGDGRKVGSTESITTNSPVLAQGLYLLYSQANRKVYVSLQHRDGKHYYALNLASIYQPWNTPIDIVRSNKECSSTPPTYLYDIETDSGLLCAGVGRLVIHNSGFLGIFAPGIATRFREKGAKLVLTLNDHHPRNNEQLFPFVKEFDKVVVHQKTENEPWATFIPIGIDVLKNSPWSAENTTIGIAGFPLPQKRTVEVAMATAICMQEVPNRIKGCIMVCPESQHVDTHMIERQVLAACPQTNYVSQWLSQKQVQEIMATNLVNVYPMSDGKSGISSSVRMAIATGSYMVLSRSWMFKDLMEEYENEFEWIDGDAMEVTPRKIADAIKRVITNGKRPNRILKDWTWKASAEKYVELYRSLVKHGE